MELLIFGHAGAKVLVFPTRDGRFYEYENLRIVDALRHKIDAGQLQLYCLDSVDWETFYCWWCHPADRVRRHTARGSDQGSMQPCGSGRPAMREPCRDGPSGNR